MDWRSGKQEAKGEILTMQAVNPSKWKDFLVHESNTLTRKVTKEVKKKRYYRGELVQLHGQEEFDDFVSKGKFEVGDECFYKKKKAEIDSLEMACVAKAQKTRSNATGGEVDASNSALKNSKAKVEKAQQAAGSWQGVINSVGTKLRDFLI